MRLWLFVNRRVTSGNLLQCNDKLEKGHPYSNNIARIGYEQLFQAVHSIDSVNVSRCPWKLQQLVIEVKGLIVEMPMKMMSARI